MTKAVQQEKKPAKKEAVTKAKATAQDGAGKPVKQAYNSYNVIRHPLATEKSVRLLQSENKLHLVVDMRATKPEIKRSVESMWKVKVHSVKTMISPKGKKIAYVRLAKEHPAIDIATDLGLM